MESLRERLAAYSHEAWSGWMKYMFDKSPFNEDGTWTMPTECVERWVRQMSTPYNELPSGEEESDLDEADKIWRIILESRFQEGEYWCCYIGCFEPAKWWIQYAPEDGVSPDDNYTHSCSKHLAEMLGPGGNVVYLLEGEENFD